MIWFKKKKEVIPEQRSMTNYSMGCEGNRHWVNVSKTECFADVVPDEVSTVHGGCPSFVFYGNTDIEAWIKATNATIYIHKRNYSKVPESYQFQCPICGTPGRITQYQCHCRTARMKP